MQGWPEPSLWYIVPQVYTFVVDSSLHEPLNVTQWRPIELSSKAFQLTIRCRSLTCIIHRILLYYRDETPSETFGFDLLQLKRMFDIVISPPANSFHYLINVLFKSNGVAQNIFEACSLNGAMYGAWTALGLTWLVASFFMCCFWLAVRCAWAVWSYTWAEFVFHRGCLVFNTIDGEYVFILQLLILKILFSEAEKEDIGDQSSGSSRFWFLGYNGSYPICSKAFW